MWSIYSNSRRCVKSQGELVFFQPSSTLIGGLSASGGQYFLKFPSMYVFNEMMQVFIFIFLPISLLNSMKLTILKWLMVKCTCFPCFPLKETYVTLPIHQFRRRMGNKIARMPIWLSQKIQFSNLIFFQLNLFDNFISLQKHNF